jgi:hypothetical protein
VSVDRRRPGSPQGPIVGPSDGWLELSDDELLYRIEALPRDHDLDLALMGVVRSVRHFFIRQEAAKRIRDPELLKAHAGDRHIGQILARVMTRAADVAYLEKLRSESKHLEVRKAAEAQLRIIRERSRPARAGRS